MEALVTVLYVLAMALSVWGVFGPYWAARRFSAKAQRAKARRIVLERRKYAEQDAGNEGAYARFQQALEVPFEGGPETLDQLSQGWIFKGGSPAMDALEDARARARGLAWVVSGICVASIASIIAVWALPTGAG